MFDARFERPFAVRVWLAEPAGNGHLVLPAGEVVIEAALAMRSSMRGASFRCRTSSAMTGPVAAT